MFVQVELFMSYWFQLTLGALICVDIPKYLPPKLPRAQSWRIIRRRSNFQRFSVWGKAGMYGMYAYAPTKAIYSAYVSPVYAAKYKMLPTNFGQNP